VYKYIIYLLLDANHRNGSKKLIVVLITFRIICYIDLDKDHEKEIRPLLSEITHISN